MSQTSAPVQYAVCGSTRREHGRVIGGLDIYEITGHCVLGETVYLRLRFRCWVRDEAVLRATPPPGLGEGS